MPTLQEIKTQAAIEQAKKDKAKAERSNAASLWQTVGQIPAEIGAMTIANSATPQDKINGPDYRPAVVDQIGGLISLADMGVSAAKDYLGYETDDKGFKSGIDGLDTYVNKSVDRIAAARKSAQDFVGVEEAENVGQAVVGAVGASLIPLPVKFGPTASAGRGAAVTARAAQAAKTLGKTAVEIAIPFRTSPIKGAVLVNSAFTTGAMELSDALDGTEADGYASITDAITGTKAEPKTTGFYPKEIPTTYITMYNRGDNADWIAKFLDDNDVVYDREALDADIALRDDLMSKGTFTPQEYEVPKADADEFYAELAKVGIYATPEDVIRVARSTMGATFSPSQAKSIVTSVREGKPISLGGYDQEQFAIHGKPKNMPYEERLAANSPIEQVSEEPIEPSPLVKAGMIAAGILGGGLAAKTAVQFARTFGTPRTPAANLTEERNVPSLTGDVVTKLKAREVNFTAPIGKAADEGMPPDAAAVTKYMINTAGNASVGAKSRHLFTTGETPNSRVQTKPIAPLLNSFAKLPENERQLINDALVATTALDDRAVTGTRPSISSKTTPELIAARDAVVNNPKLAQYYHDVKDSFRDMIKFLNAEGIISNAEYNKMIKRHPNYVPLRKKETVDGIEQELPNSGIVGANNLDSLFSRSEDLMGGVQQAVEPITLLQEQWSKVIRIAQHNNIRKQFIQDFNQNITVKDSLGNNVPVIRRINVTNKKDLYSQERIVAIDNSGNKEFYQINDGNLYEALKFNPRVVQEVSNALRGTYQSFTTGLGNVFGAFRIFTSPIYDMYAATSNRATGRNLGIASEIVAKGANKLGVNINPQAAELLRMLDPTQLITPLTGAARGISADIVNNMAKGLTQRLMENSAMVRIVGQQNVESLRDSLANVYEGTIRSMVDKEGISSASGYGANLMDQTDTGLSDIAPNYARLQWAEGMRDAKGWRKGLQASKYPLVQLRSRAIGRTYDLLLRNLQDGARIQYLAANSHVPQNHKQLQQLLGDVSNVVGDPARYGKSGFNSFMSSNVPYYNTAVAEMAAHGRKIKEDGVTSFAMNTMLGIVLPVMALRYGPAALGDQEAVEKQKTRTPFQNLTGFSSFGGMEVPINPTHRLLLNPMFTYLDAMFTNPDGSIDPDFGQLIKDYLNDDIDPVKQENYEIAQEQANKNAFRSVMPVNPESIPIVNAGAAALGVDLSATSLIGEPTAPRSADKYNPVDGDSGKPDGLVSAYTSNLVYGLLGTGAKNWMDILDGFYRGMTEDNLTGEVATNKDGAIRIAKDEFMQQASRVQIPIEPLLGLPIVKSESIANTNFFVLQAKADGIDKAKLAYDENIKNVGFTGSMSRPKSIMQKIKEQPLLDARGSKMDILGQLTFNKESYLKLNTKLTAIDGEISILTDHAASVRNEKGSTTSEKNKVLNEINAKRKLYNDQKLVLIRDAEQQIREVIQEPEFTFQKLNDREYIEYLLKTPLTPPQGVQ